MSGVAVRHAVLVAAAFLVVAVTSAVWLAVDRRPPEWDYASHLERGVLCVRDLAHGEVRAVLLRSTFYPPVVPCLGGLAGALAPSDVAAGVAVVVAFLGLGMAATYLLGRRFAGSAAGVAAAVVFGTSPFLVWQSLRFQLDVPLAAMVALALEVLLRTEGFTRPGRSIVAGLVFGLGMLTKPPFAVYLLPSVLLVLGGVRRWRALAGLLVFAAVGTAVALPWYGPRLFIMAGQVGARSFRQAAEQGYPEPLSAASLAFYPLHLAVLLGVLGVALLAVGAVECVQRRRWEPLVALLPFLVFLGLQNKQLRYVLPLVPAAATVAAVGFSALAPRLRTVVAVALAVMAVVQTSTAAFDVPPASRLIVAGVPLAIGEPPWRARWPHRDILAAVEREAAGREVTLSVVPNHPFFSPANFRYYAVRDDRPVHVARAWDEEPIGVDFMVLKTGDIGPPFTAERPRRIDERLATDHQLARVFPVIAEFPLPDGSLAVLRARRVPPVDTAPAAVAGAIQAALRRSLDPIARDVSGLEIALAYDGAIVVGRLRRVDVRAAAVTVGDFRRRRTPLRVRDLHLIFEDVVVNPWSALAEERLEPLDVGSARLARAQIAAEDLVTFLHGQKTFRRARVQLEDGTVTLDLPRWGPDVHARVRIEPAQDRPFIVASERVVLGGVPLPAMLVNWVMRHFDPSMRIAARTPFDIAIGPVRVTPDAVHIGE